MSSHYNIQERAVRKYFQFLNNACGIGVFCRKNRELDIVNFTVLSQLFYQFPVKEVSTLITCKAVLWFLIINNSKAK